MRQKQPQPTRTQRLFFCIYFPQIDPPSHWDMESIAPILELSLSSSGGLRDLPKAAQGVNCIPRPLALPTLMCLPLHYAAFCMQEMNIPIIRLLASYYK